MSRRPAASTQRPSRPPSVSGVRGARFPAPAGVRAAPAPAGDDPRRRRLSTAASAAGAFRVPAHATETNINVVVRCRGRSEAEIAEGTPSVVTTEGGPLSKAITVETTPAAAAAASVFTTASAYPGNGHPSTRKYPFDKVFGPEADQTMIFTEVAEGMLDEVLAGYNCTIFAYGQTGTGKTYTMQGDTTPTPFDRPTHDAGIIPRVLHKLFSLLEAQENTEYAVKCSYIELYNEELRDLLAPEYKDSVGTSNIKIFEDSSKKGVTVQGVEESGLLSLKDGLAALAKGTQRRQTAETKLNSESSRSHSIFTLTVHIRESNLESGEEDLLRIGKFNLVDLAGSEAIGRSGAENKRAREAGMINQSLLTLGRVISALVDKGSHIPYRESKLTRLLQDSLGGRTKTCIVATVSPTRSNMEETISTLDYALRAKSIKNKPEVNAHLTKAGLLREYIADVERLKAELFATREKNGIWIPDDIYKEMQHTQTRQKSDFDDARQRLATIEVELKSRKAEFEMLTSRFVTTTEELAEARQAESQLTELLAQVQTDMATMRTALSEEKVVSEAYQAGEERLHNVASELHSVATESVRDVGGLFDKLGRLTNVLDTNTDGAARFGSEMHVLSADLRDGLEHLYSVQASFGDKLQQDLMAYAERGEAESEVHLNELNSTFDAFKALATSLSSTIEQGAANDCTAADAVLTIKEEVQASVRAWSQGVAARGTEMADALLKHQGQHLAVVGTVLETSTSLLDAVITAARRSITAQTTAFEAAKALADSAAAAEVARLRRQNEQLTRLLNEEQATTAKLRTDLIENISSMIVGFTDTRNANLSAALSAAQASNDAGVKSVSAFAREHAEAMDQAVETADAFSRGLEEQSAAVERQRGEGEKALASVQSGMREWLEPYGRRTSAEAEEHVRTVDAFCDRLGTTAGQLSADAARRTTAQEAIVTSISQNASDSFERAAKRVKRDAGGVSHLTSTLLASHASSVQTSTARHATAQSQLADIESATARFLTDIAIDEPTGTTPRKRAYPLPSWKRTEPRYMLLDACRRRTVAGARMAYGVSAPAEADAAPRLSTGSSTSTASEASVRTQASERDLPTLARVDSGLSVASLKSSASGRSRAGTNSLDSSINCSSFPPPLPSAELFAAPAAAAAPARQLSASGLGGPRLPSPKRIAGKLSRERDPERGVSMNMGNVLGDGGNVPRPRRRGA